MDRKRRAGLVCSTVVAALVLASLGIPARGVACSCQRGSVETALAGAALVAEIQILEVGRPADPGSDMTTQPMRARVVRIFATETSVSDGDEIVFIHRTCNSLPYGLDEAGARYVAFLGSDRGFFTQHYCSFDLSAWEPLPHVLLQARRRWLARH